MSRQTGYSVQESSVAHAQMLALPVHLRTRILCVLAELAELASLAPLRLSGQTGSPPVECRFSVAGVVVQYRVDSQLQTIVLQSLRGNAVRSA